MAAEHLADVPAASLRTEVDPVCVFFVILTNDLLIERWRSDGFIDVIRRTRVAYASTKVSVSFESNAELCTMRECQSTKFSLPNPSEMGAES